MILANQVFDPLYALARCVLGLTEGCPAQLARHEQLHRGIPRDPRPRYRTRNLTWLTFVPLVCPAPLVRGFSGLEGPVRTKVWRALLAGLKGLTKSFEQGLPEAQNAHEARNAVKMYMFILNWICMDEEAEAARATKHLSAASQKAAQVSGWAWSVERTRAVSAMGQLLQLGINRLWPMSCPEEQLVSLFTRVAYLLLENPAVLKDRSTKEDVFYLLGTLVHKYNHALGATTSIVHLLPHFEHLAGGMAELLQTLATEHDSGRVVGDVMREIGRMDSKELARDASGARNYSVFLQELGDRLPDTVLVSATSALWLEEPPPLSFAPYRRAGGLALVTDCAEPPPRAVLRLRRTS